MKKQKKYKNDLYKIYSRFENQWLALTPNESKLLGHSPDLLETVKMAEKKGYKNLRFIHIPCD